LLLGFGENGSVEEGFTHVLSKRSKKALRLAVKVRLGKQRVDENGRSRGAQSK
jgi:hypothetical protein